VADVSTLVDAYLSHEDVVQKQPGSGHFEFALRVYTRQEFTLPALADSSVLCYEHDEDHPADLYPTHESVLQRRKALSSRPEYSVAARYDNI
jgi:hypothetical protein